MAPENVCGQVDLSIVGQMLEKGVQYIPGTIVFVFNLVQANGGFEKGEAGIGERW